MMKYLLFVLCIGSSLQDGHSDKTFAVDLAASGARIKVDGLDDTKLSFQVKNTENEVYLEVMKVSDDGYWEASIGDCKNYKFKMESSVNGNWALRLTKDAVQLAKDGMLYVYFAFAKQECAKDLYYADIFKEIQVLTEAGSIDISPLTQWDTKNCKYVPYPDLDKCYTRDSKCFAAYQKGCNCEGAFFWETAAYCSDDKENESMDANEEQIPCDICLKCGFEWHPQGECRQEPHGCVRDFYPKCNCDDESECKDLPSPRKEECSPDECMDDHHSGAGAGTQLSVLTGILGACLYV